MNKKKKMYGKGGSKPDYLDFDKDGNKEESMKSALKNKKKKGGAKMMYATGGEWILDPVPELFQDGGARAIRKEKRAKRKDERENKRAEKKIGRLQKRTARQAERAGKKMAKNIQKGQDLEEKLATTPAERRAMKKSDRQAKRDARKADRKVRRSVRKSDRLNKRADKLNQKANKLRGKAMPKAEPKTIEKVDTTPVKNEPIKATPPAENKMSFKDTFAAERKKQGPGGTFMWRGKKYTTDRADDKKKENSNLPKKKVRRGGMRY
tara:strand:- start:493 stop:1287 length:795 start_codon:yes stop_codon:yes gene_type:complete